MKIYDGQIVGISRFHSNKNGKDYYNLFVTYPDSDCEGYRVGNILRDANSLDSKYLKLGTKIDVVRNGQYHDFLEQKEGK